MFSRSEGELTVTVFEFLKNEKVADIAALPLEKCRITKERLISDAPEGCFAVMLVLPYPVTEGELFASFSLIPDYHIFFQRLGERVSEFLKEKYGEIYVKVFADHSPIDERLAACNAGLGVYGDNGLFISEKYGSFVFLGEMICSLSEEDLKKEGIPLHYTEIRECLHCGACEENCPAGAVSGDKKLCVSNLTQKKGDLSDTERSIIKKSGYVWGCDKCALVCPMNRFVIKGDTNSGCDFFSEGAISPSRFEDIATMSDDEYGKYPFSWRKKEILKRNFEIFGL